MSAIFHQFFIFNQIIAFQKLWKMFFISSKKLFSFLRYSNFCIFVFPAFFPVSHCFRGWFKKNLKIYDVINCLNKNLITHLVRGLSKTLKKLTLFFLLNPVPLNRQSYQKQKGSGSCDQSLFKLRNKFKNIPFFII